MWFFKFFLIPNAAEQVGHLWGLIPSCTDEICLFKSTLWQYVAGQVGHLWGLIPSCTVEMCCFKWFGFVRECFSCFCLNFLKDNLARSNQKCSSKSMICVEMKIQPFNLSSENNLCLANWEKSYKSMTWIVILINIFNKRLPELCLKQSTQSW